MLSIDTILMLIAGSVAIIVTTVGVWIYLLTKNDEEWEKYSDGDPKDRDPDYEKIMKEVRAKGIKKDFDNDIPF